MSDLELVDPFDPEAHARVEPAPPPPVSPKPVRAGDATPASLPGLGGPSGAKAEGRVAWKAAASSVPRLRQKPVSETQTVAPQAFPGFAQDERPVWESSPIGQQGAREADALPGDTLPVTASPLAVEPPFWEIWLDRARALPLPLVLGAGVVLLVGVVAVRLLLPHDEAAVSLARIRQQPEAFDGRLVRVQGKAGEAFSIAGSYVFNLRQGRDTIVVYSRTRPRAPNQNVRATGTVLVGYLDGMPRIALFEVPPKP